MTREEAIKQLNAWAMRGDTLPVVAIHMAIEALQTEVVRCKDCKHRRDMCPMRYIETVGEDERIHDYSTDIGYCSWGERKGGEDE